MPLTTEPGIVDQVAERKSLIGIFAILATCLYICYTVAYGEVTKLALFLFTSIWLGYYAFIYKEYLGNMRAHRRGNILADWAPDGPHKDQKFKRVLIWKLLDCWSDWGFLTAQALAQLEPPRRRNHDTNQYPDWLEAVIRFCQDIMMYSEEPWVNAILFWIVAAIGWFLFVHRMWQFYKHGVEVDPLKKGWFFGAFSSGRRWAILGAFGAWVTDGGDYKESCNDFVAKKILRKGPVKIVLDFLILQMVRFLAETGRCERGKLSFDSRVECGSWTQVAFVFIAAPAFVGLYVYVTIKILRSQNHYPLAKGSGDPAAPEDMFDPFFVVAMFQTKIGLGGVNALAPTPYVVLPVSIVCTGGLLLRCLWHPPCRFRAVNAARVAVYIIVSFTITTAYADMPPQRSGWW